MSVEYNNNILWILVHQFSFVAFCIYNIRLRSLGVSLNVSPGFKILCIERYMICKDERYMTIYIHSPNLITCLVVRKNSRWQVCSTTVQSTVYSDVPLVWLTFLFCSCLLDLTLYDLFQRGYAKNKVYVPPNATNVANFPRTHHCCCDGQWQ